jgi:tRNA A-37 threonylcarbamoyl transferase component Bud32
MKGTDPVAVGGEHHETFDKIKQLKRKIDQSIFKDCIQNPALKKSISGIYSLEKMNHSKKYIFNRLDQQNLKQMNSVVRPKTREKDQVASKAESKGEGTPSSSNNRRSPVSQLQKAKECSLTGAGSDCKPIRPIYCDVETVDRRKNPKLIHSFRALDAVTAPSSASELKRNKSERKLSTDKAGGSAASGNRLQSRDQIHESQDKHKSKDALSKILTSKSNQVEVGGYATQFINEQYQEMMHTANLKQSQIKFIESARSSILDRQRHKLVLKSGLRTRGESRKAPLKSPPVPSAPMSKEEILKNNIVSLLGSKEDLFADSVDKKQPKKAIAKTVEKVAIKGERMEGSGSFVENRLNKMCKLLECLENDTGLKDHKQSYRDQLNKFQKTFHNTSRLDNHFNSIDHEKLRKYKVVKQIGDGASSVVSLVIDRVTQQKYAMKVYDKLQYSETLRNNLMNEVEILSKCNHPNIIKLIDWFEGSKKIYLILEYVGSATLAKYLDKKLDEMMTEDEAAHVFYELSHAIAYLHKRKIYHRDLKLHNIIIGSEGQVKLIDFGYAIQLTDDSKVATYCGTPSYMSPEVISKTPYNPEKYDIWAFGICLFRALCGYFPFKGVSQTNLFFNIKKGSFVIRPTISTKAQSLLMILIQQNPEARPSIAKVEVNPWFAVHNYESTTCEIHHAN